MIRIRPTSIRISARARKRIHAAGAVTVCALLAALAGCAASPPLFLSDGRPTTQIQCSATDSGSCHAQAQARCNGGGFDVVGQTDQDNTRTLVFACQKQ